MNEGKHNLMMRKIQVNTEIEIDIIIDERETYFLSFKVVKKEMKPTIKPSQQLVIINPQKVATAFPPLNPAKIGQQCPIATPKGAK